MRVVESLKGNPRTAKKILEVAKKYKLEVLQLEHTENMKRQYERLLNENPECRGCLSIDQFVRELFITEIDKKFPRLREYVDIEGRTIPELAYLLKVKEQQAELTDSRV